jgi:cobyrinic acid a,c-diamide synthase
MLQASVEPGQWLGAVLRNAAMALPKRHLGLTVATEVADAMERLDAAADTLAATPLGQMTLDDLQRWAVDFTAAEASVSVLPALQGKTIAIARDAAFCFIYAANLETLRALGAELVFFSPLIDAALPACDALWIPGGYPELHAETIAANTPMRGSLAAHIAAGKPVWAECGGMMALFDTLVTMDGQRHAQWGVMPGEVTMQKLLAGLGPQQLPLASGTLRGHTFHYSTTATPLKATARTARPGTEPSSDAGEAVWQQGAVRASYFHAWFPSCPEAVVELFTAPAEVTA